jgi:ATP-dependent phosphoenolpyruvate carboxykinase
MTEASGEHPFAALVRERNGVPLASPADVPFPLGEFGFAAILATGAEILPPVARLGPWQAGAWLLLAEAGAEIGDDGVSAAQTLAEALASSGAPAFLVTAGRVGGTGAYSHEIEPGLVAGVLDAALAEEIDWEEDPDFGYELPMEGPGIGVEERRVLVPRFLYARTDRVYDYAAMVPAAQRERAARLDSAPGASTAMCEAVAPPRRRA